MPPAILTGETSQPQSLHGVEIVAGVTGNIVRLGENHFEFYPAVDAGKVTSLEE